jgi:hypothetical protein
MVATGLAGSSVSINRLSGQRPLQQRADIAAFAIDSAGPDHGRRGSIGKS